MVLRFAASIRTQIYNAYRFIGFSTFLYWASEICLRKLSYLYIDLYLHTYNSEIFLSTLNTTCCHNDGLLVVIVTYS